MPGLWICLIILHLRQAFEDALSSKCARVLNMAWLYMQGLQERNPKLLAYIDFIYFTTMLILQLNQSNLLFTPLYDHKLQFISQNSCAGLTFWYSCRAGGLQLYYCFLVNIAKFLRTFILKNIYERLLLYFQSKSY